MDAQVPPATGARLTTPAVEALIARRLDALGREPDLLDAGAIAALVADAGGSGRRLRSSLAATLFLASTEDAAQIDAGLVHRALAPPPTAAMPIEHRPPPVGPKPAMLNQEAPNSGRLAALSAHHGSRWLAKPRFLFAAGGVALAALVAAVLLRPAAEKPVIAAEPTAPPQTVAIQQPSLFQQPPEAAKPPATPDDTARTQANQSQASAATQSPAAATPAQPAPAATVQTEPAPAVQVTQAALPALPPAVVVPSPPVPATDPPKAASARPSVLPVAAPASIILLYPSRDSGALNRLRPIAEKLQRAGMTDIRAKPIHAPSPRRVISYFYAEDRPLADTIARTLTGSVWPHLTGETLQPSLVLPPAGIPGRNPGTIEVQLP